MCGTVSDDEPNSKVGVIHGMKCLGNIEKYFISRGISKFDH